MPEKMARWLFELQCKQGRLGEDNRKLYVYAYNLFISRVLIYMILLLAGLLLGNLKEMAVFLLGFIPLRQYTGGIHLDGARNCIALSCILICLSGQYLKYYPQITALIFLGWIVAVCIIISLAPVGCSNKKLDFIEKRIYKRRSRIVLGIECVMFFISYIMEYIWISKGIILVQIALAVSLILGWIKNFFE